MEPHLFNQKVTALRVTACNIQRCSSGRPGSINARLGNSSSRGGRKKGKDHPVLEVALLGAG